MQIHGRSARSRSDGAPIRAPRQVHALVAAMFFAIAAGIDVWHLVTGQPFGELARTASLAIATVDVLVWCSAALLLVLRPASDALMRASFMLSIAGAVLVFLHGLVLGGPLEHPLGLPLAITGIVLGVVLKRAWTPFPWARREPPSSPARTTVRTAGGREHPAI